MGAQQIGAADLTTEAQTLAGSQVSSSSSETNVSQNQWKHGNKLKQEICFTQETEGLSTFRS